MGTTYKVKIDADGVVTIPVEVCEKYGLLPGYEVEFEEQDEGVLVRRVQVPAESRGEQFVRRLRSLRPRLVDPDLTTDDIMKMTRGE
jgi:bifunctional DNA-binding transcriptional regulator/antitoxin component of YhaV-PrlF toxin-antitoxin module